MPGQVVGINTAIAGQAQNIGFAIAIDHAKALIDQLQKGKVPAHALFGVSTQPTDDGHGVAVATVDPGSAADKAGLQTGDVITKVGDTVIDSPDTSAAADRRPTARRSRQGHLHPRRRDPDRRRGPRHPVRHQLTARYVRQHLPRRVG